MKHLDPVINLSVWLALEIVNERNACVKLIPGSHQQVVPHIDSDIAVDHPDFAFKADSRCINPNEAVCMEMEAGQYFLFDAQMVHGSSANNSHLRRAGLSVRVTVPRVKVKIGKDEVPLLVRGQDRFGYNQLAQPPQVL